MERRVTTDDGVQLWCRDDGGDGHQVARCHGGPGLWDDLGPLADLLPPSTRAIRRDQRGGAEVRVIPGAGHLPWVEAPDETAGAIGSFLAAHGLDR